MTAISSSALACNHGSTVIHRSGYSKDGLAVHEPITSHTTSAAERVHQLPELWTSVLRQSNRRTLTVLLRLDRDSLARTAEVLYERIGLLELHELEEYERPDVYCASVRHIDLVNVSPRRRLAGRLHTPIFPSIYEPCLLLAALQSLRASYPRLRTVTYRLAGKGPECINEHVLVRFWRGDIMLQVEEEILVDPYTYPLDHSKIRFCPTPIAPGLRINKHTYAIRILGKGSDRPRLPTPTAAIRSAAALKSFLYDNPDLDRRVSRIEHAPKDALLPLLSFDDAMAFADARRNGGCEPLSGIHLDPAHPLSMAQLLLLGKTTGPDLAALHLAIYTPSGLVGFTAVLDALGLVFPRLAELRLTCRFGDSTPLPMVVVSPLAGLLNLRRLVVFQDYSIGGSGIIREIAQARTRDCTVDVWRVA